MALTTEAGVCVCKIVSHFISLISAAFYAPIRSLTLQHIQSIGRKTETKGEKRKKKSLLTSFAPSRKLYGKKKRGNERKISFISVGNPKSSLRPQPKTKLKRLECWDV